MSQEKDSPKTLESFIEKYEKLLTVMGVFGGLTALFTQIEGGTILVFLTFSIFFLLGMELYAKFPAWKELAKGGEDAIRLFIFRILLTVLVIGIAVYLLYYYSTYSALAVIEIGLLCTIVFGEILSPKIFKWLQKHEKITYFFGAIITGILGLLFLVGVLILLLVIIWVLSFFGIQLLPPS